jgi:Ner family transcriptional regulator
MERLNISKKPVEQVALQDWHPADIKAALEKAGWTLRQLSIAHGYAPDTLKNALREARPVAQDIIGTAIGVKPQVIWPTRYDDDGAPRRELEKRDATCAKPAPALDPYRVKSITASAQRYVEVTPGN